MPKSKKPEEWGENDAVKMLDLRQISEKFRKNVATSGKAARDECHLCHTSLISV